MVDDMTDDIELPPLTKHDHPDAHAWAWRSDELIAIKEYARAAVIADRARRALQGLADADRELGLDYASPPTPPADDRPRWGTPHAGTIRCLYAAIERLYAGDTPAEVFDDYGWSMTPEQPAPSAEAVAWQWLQTGHFRRRRPPTTAEPGAWRPLYLAPPPTPPADAQITVEVERGRVWIKRGVQSWMLAYKEDEPAAVEWYAQTLRAALEGK